jgi:hypothetical protein
MADNFLNGPGPGLGRAVGWVWPIATGGVCAAIALRPEVTLLVLGGTVLLVCAVLLPHVTVGLAVLAILGVRTLIHLVPVTELGYLDEGMVLLCAVALPLRRLGSGRGLRSLPGQGFFAVFAGLGLLGGAIVGVPSATLLVAAFLMLKGILFGWAVAQLDWNARHLSVAAKAGVVLIVVCLAASAANAAAPGVWTALLANVDRIDYRFGLPSLVGPFVHPLDLGHVMTAATIALLTWRAAVGRSPLTLVLMIGTGATALLTFRRTALAAVLVAVLWIKTKLGAARLLLTAALVLPIAGILLFAPLKEIVTLTYDDYIVGGDTSARTLLVRDSVEVAAGHFPLGAGFGRFGSQTAAVSYSPEYVVRGYPAIWGLGATEKSGQFLTDTEWPAIVGESGLIGAVAFALGLAAMYRRGRRVWTDGTSPLVRWAGLLLMGWVVAYLMLSIASVVFTGPPAFGLLFGLAGIVATLPVRPDGARRHRARDSGPGRRAARALQTSR